VILGLGTDLVDVERMRGVLARRAGFVDRVFHPAEQDYADRQNDPTQRYAARFAAKESVMKALGVGLGAIAMADIEVTKEPSGAPGVRLHGSARELAERRGVDSWKISLSHTDTAASAVVVALGSGPS